MSEDNNKDKKTTSEKPIKIPLDFKEVLSALLNTKPPKDNQEEKEGKEKPGDHAGRSIK